MEALSTPGVAGGLAAGNLLYTSAVLIYAVNRTGKLGCELDQLREDLKHGRGAARSSSSADNLEAVTNDVYSRLEAAENVQQIIGQRIMRLESMMNAVISALTAQNVHIKIDPQQRRIPTSSKSRSTSAPPSSRGKSSEKPKVEPPKVVSKGEPEDTEGIDDIVNAAAMD